MQHEHQNKCLFPTQVQTAELSEACHGNGPLLQKMPIQLNYDPENSGGRSYLGIAIGNG